MSNLDLLAKDRFAAMTGIKLTRLEPGYAVARVELEEKHLNAANVVQGGVTFTLADFAMAAAANAHGQVALAINCSIDFFRPPQGQYLLAEAKEVHFSNKLATYNVEVRDENGSLVALYKGTVYRKNEKLETG